MYGVHVEGRAALHLHLFQICVIDGRARILISVRIGGNTERIQTHSLVSPIVPNSD